MYPWSTKDKGSWVCSWSGKCGGKRMAKQLDCTTSIASTQNNVFHGLHFSQYTTFNRLHHIASRRTGGSISIWGVAWTTSKWNHFNRQMLCESCRLKMISGLAMMVGLKMIRLSSEHHSAGIYWNVSSCICRIAHFRRISILSWCASRTWKVAEYTPRSSLASGGGIHKMRYLPERRLCQSFVHQTRLTCLIFEAIGLLCYCISWLVIIEKISAVHLQGIPCFSIGWFHVPQKVANIQMWDGIPHWEQCWPHCGILT